MWENIQYQLDGCKRQAPHSVCTVKITNLGASDATLIGGKTYYVDQAGDRVGVAEQKVANCNLGRCDALPNLTMAGQFIFNDEDGQASELVRLQLANHRGAVAQFTHVPVQ